MLGAVIHIQRRRSSRDDNEDGTNDSDEEASIVAARPYEELQEISNYFPDVVDNSTEFFLTMKEYESPVHAMSDVLAIPFEKARKFHQIGASYMWVDKFRRTHHPRADGPVPTNTVFRVYINPR